MDQPHINININDTEKIVCTKCSGELFSPAFYMRKVPAAIAGKVSIVPIQVFECVACGHVNEIFLPEELRETNVIS